MTINILVATKDFIAALSDRRLTAAADPAKIVSESSTKVTTFACADARGLITYNGVGQDSQGVTPGDWLADINDMHRLSFDGFIQRVEDIGNDRLKLLSKQFGGVPRHTFAIVAELPFFNVAGVISNYEDVRGPPALKASPLLKRDLLKSVDINHALGLVFGDTRDAEKAFKDDLAPKLRSRAPEATIVRGMFKTARAAAYRRERKGSVGPSFQGAIWRRGSPQAEGLYRTPGASSVQEMPNVLFPGISMRDIRFAVVGPNDSPPWRVGIRRPTEKRCRRCNAPVPAGYRRCGVCDSPL